MTAEAVLMSPPDTVDALNGHEIEHVIMLGASVS